MNQLRKEYEAVFNNAQDAMFLFDVDRTGAGYEFRLRRLNPAHESISGLSSEEDRGKTPEELLGPEDGEAVATNYRRCVEAEEPISYDEVLEMPAGDFTWHTVLAPVIKDGDVTQIVGVSRDISHRRKRERELRAATERLNVALRATNTGVWEWNLETDEVFWNEALERLLDLEPGSFAGTYEAHEEYLHPDAVPKIENAVTEALNGDGVFQAEFRMIRDDGETIWVIGRGELQMIDGTRKMIGTTTDITDRKETEQALALRETVDPSVELEFRSEKIAGRLFEHTEGELHLSSEGVVPGPGDSLLLYVTVSGPTTSEARSMVDGLPPVREARLLRSVGDSSRYEVLVDSGSAASVFHEFDGEIQSIEVADAVVRITGIFPESIDAKALTQALQQTYADIELASRRHVASPSHLRVILEEELSERQRTILGMAYYSGYFDQPREATGEKLAGQLGITRQTFNEHLRKAQQQLLQTLFEESIEFPT